MLGLDAAAGLEAVREFNRLNRHARVESLEAKGTDATSTDAVLAVIPSDWPRYVEIPFGDAGERALERLARARACAKIRTGGLTQEAFPDPDALLAFLEAAVRLGLPFKATAGLHHPLRGSYRLTYEANPPKGVMFGYLNLLLATALLREGSTTPEARKALVEQEDAAITADPGGLTWRDHRFTTEHLRMMRDELFHGFGSCSFREPMDELAAAWG